MVGRGLRARLHVVISQKTVNHIFTEVSISNLAMKFSFNLRTGKTDVASYVVWVVSWAL
jgi:hypothetical protein